MDLDVTGGPNATKGFGDLLSDRRRRALKLLDEDLSLNEVARRVHCAASSVMRCGMTGGARADSLRWVSLRVVREGSREAKSAGCSGSY